MDFGDLEITQRKNHSFDWSPAIGGVMILAGGGMYLVGARGK